MADSTGDVEMVDAGRVAAPLTTGAVLDRITSGQLDALPSFAPRAGSQSAVQAPGDGAEVDDAELDLLAPFLPLLTRLHDARRATIASSGSPFVSILDRYDAVNELSEYTRAVQSLTLADVAGVASDSADATPLHRRFESADVRERACVVLHLVLAFADGAVATDALHENELVRNDIYKPHLVAILVNALAVDTLAPHTESGVTLAKVVRFSLVVPLGVDLVEAVVLNDPSSFGHVVDVIVESIHTCNPLQATPTEANAVSSMSAAATSLLPYELRQAQAACSALAALSPSYAVMVAYRLREDVASIAAAFVAFQLIVELPALREDHFYAPFVHQWQRMSAAEKNPSTTALHVFLHASLSREGDAQSDQDKSQPIPAGPAASFVEEARYVMSQFRQLLIDDMVQFHLPPTEDAKTPSRFTFVAMLNVLIGFLVIGRLHPEDHETSQLLKMFDKVTKEIPLLQPKPPMKNFERMISLMYVLVLLLCSPSAPAFAKMPSQREDSTKLVLQLAQQCIYSLYNTKAACPLFVLSSVLLYTKSPSLLPCLNSFLGDTFPLTAATVRVEHLHGVGDAILKPILTENVMAREALTVFEPSMNASARDHDPMEEMVLRSMHGLLSEKSFLRHHHGRKLEEWVTQLVDRATTPVHPLITSVLLEWIENYVMAFEYPISQRPVLQLAIIPLSPGYVSRALNHSLLASTFAPANKREWARAVLVLIYALQFNQRLRMASAMPGTKLSAFANQGASDASDQPGTQPVRGSSDILLSYELEAYPLKNILMQVSRFAGVGGLFEFAAPTLCRLMAEEYPGLVVDGAFAAQRKESLPHSVSCKQKLIFVSAEDARDKLPVVSWNSMCMWLSDLHIAPRGEVEQAFHYCTSTLLPLAVLSLDIATGEEIGPEAFFAAFWDFYKSYAHGESADPVHLDRQIAEALCIPQVVWRHYQQGELRKSQQGAGRLPSSSIPVWIHHNQLVEQPFYILQNAHPGVLSSVSLLCLALDLVKRFRAECIFQLRRRETIGLLAKKAVQANDATNNGVAASPVSSSDPATQQFLMIQDCILVQSMLGLVATLTVGGSRHERDECVFVLYKVIDEFLLESKASAAAPPASTSPPLALTIHCQGYDSTLVTSFVDQAPSLKQLWMHWMHQPSAEVSNTKNANDRRGGSNATPSHAAAKAISDFVSDSATEKDLIKWQFRVRVFFKLCEKYFTAPAHSTPTMQTIKQILNRLRGIAVSSSGSSKGVLHALSIGDNTARVAFVEAVLNDAIDGCGPHPELRAEIAQFLLNLKKHVGSASTQGHAAVSPNSVEASSSRGRDHHQDLERVVFRAYQKVLRLV